MFKALILILSYYFLTFALVCDGTNKKHFANSSGQYVPITTERRGFFIMEQWREIKDYEGYYQVSNIGNVRRVNKDPRSPKFRVLKKGLFKGGYEYVGIRKNRTVHRLVATAFILNPKNKAQVNHINGIKTDNHVDNLEWVTPKENQVHASKLGLTANGEKNGFSKLNEFQVREILKSNLSLCKLGKKYNVSSTNIWRIKNRKLWKHIKS